MQSLIEKTVIPRPIPRSWAKVVQPFDYEAARGKKATPGSRFITISYLSFSTDLVPQL
jgi:hypothetical protein